MKKKERINIFVINKSLLENRKSLVDREYIHLPQGVDFSLFEKERKSRHWYMKRPQIIVRTVIN